MRYSILYCGIINSRSFLFRVCAFLYLHHAIAKHPNILQYPLWRMLQRLTIRFPMIIISLRIIMHFIMFRSGNFKQGCRRETLARHTEWKCVTGIKVEFLSAKFILVSSVDMKLCAAMLCMSDCNQLPGHVSIKDLWTPNISTDQCQ